MCPRGQTVAPYQVLKILLSSHKSTPGDAEQLFVTTVRPHRPASMTTIARWIVEAILTSAPSQQPQPKTTTPSHESRPCNQHWDKPKEMMVQCQALQDKPQGMMVPSQALQDSVVVETVFETSHLRWNNETIGFKSSLTSIIIESTYLTLSMNKMWGCFKVQVGWKNAFYKETGSQKGLEKVSARPWPLNKHFLPSL